MQTQPSTSFSPFRPGLKFESTNPVDPPEGGGGTGGGTAPLPDPPEEDEETPQ
jgi:hypothetical protein